MHLNKCITIVNYNQYIIFINIIKISSFNISYHKNSNNNIKIKYILLLQINNINYTNLYLLF